MKQKIVIEVPLDCAKCKKKVLTICTTANGVNSVRLEIREGGKDGVVIEGEEVDAAMLTQRLRIKVSKYANLVSVTKDQ